MEDCVVDGVIEPGKCSETMTIGGYSSDPGRAAIFEIVGPGRTNGYIAVSPSDNRQTFDAVPRWPKWDLALDNLAGLATSGCG